MRFVVLKPVRREFAQKFRRELILSKTDSRAAQNSFAGRMFVTSGLERHAFGTLEAVVLRFISFYYAWHLSPLLK